ncbi:hypothetical protein DTL42_12870 [Bremerella cremea]|uniref:Protein kinase domain-containing protein n=1 Tax=Bremerella cremea TaxID=1031537 RepID=A0A368KTG9_9BACT|nr:protein kinase [Bremerella cremea]RCS49412.1 hypothetical protein DTL42_12870 [Bremerella cremea]
MSTFKCPQCHAELPDFQRLAGFCPNCDARWEGAAVEEDGSDNSPVLDFSESDQLPAQTDPSSEKQDQRYDGFTLELPDDKQPSSDEINQTIDLPNAAEVGQELLAKVDEKDFGQTIEFAIEDTSATIAADELNTKGPTPADRPEENDIDGQATIELPPSGSANDAMQTLDLDVEEGYAEDFGQTIDIDESKRPLSQEDLHVTIGSKPLSPSDVKRYWGAGDGSPMETMRTATVSKAKQMGVDLCRRILSDQEEGSDYAIISQIGKGGMGVVYAANQKSLHRRVAVKTLKRDIGQRENDRVKFLSEAVITGHLDHPNIVPIHELGQTEDGTLFYSMKCVTGTEWHKVIRNKTEAENLEIILKVADAIAFAHSRNVIHRDLKPENVMLGEYGEVLVMDWGLAVDLSRNEEFTMGGTPAYMAPEMAKGPLERIGKCSDIYLLGAMLYEIVTGFPPHAASTVTECLVAAAQNVIVRSDSTSRLKNIALTAMATSPKLRFASVALLQEEIRKYQSTAQSIELTNNALKELETAKETENYELFSRAMFGFEDALKLWSENDAADHGVREARLEYAKCALKKADYDLGLQLVGSSDPDEEPIYTALVRAKADAERTARNAKMARWIAVASLMFALVGAGVGLFLINAQRERAVAAEALAKGERDRANDEAQRANDEAQRANDEAGKARIAETEARRQEGIALKNLKTANELAEELKVEQAKLEDALVDVRLQKKLADFAGMFSEVGLAQSKVEANDIAAALNLLEKVPPEYRSWEWKHLAYLCHPNIPHMSFDRMATAVDISPNGQWTAIGTNGDGVYLVSAKQPIAEAKPVHLAVPDCRINVLRFSPDGKELWIGTDHSRKHLLVWNLKDPPTLVDVPKLDKYFPYNEVRSVEFAPDARGDVYVAVGGFIYRVNAKSKVAETALTAMTMFDVAVSPNGKEYVQSQEYDGRYTVRRRTADDQHDVIAELQLDEPAEHCQYLSDDQVVLAMADGSLLLWDGDSEGKESAVSLPSQVNQLRFDQSRNLLAISLVDGSIMLLKLDSESGKLMPFKTLRGHRGSVFDCAFHPSQPEVVSASEDHTARFWNYKTYRDELDVELPASVLWAGFSHDGTKFITGDRSGAAKIWSTDSQASQPLHNLHVGDWDRQNFAEQAMTIPVGAGDFLLTADPSAGVDVWDIEKQNIVWHHDTQGGSRRIVAITGTDQFIYVDAEPTDNGKQTTMLRSASTSGEPGFNVACKIGATQIVSLAVSPGGKYLAILTPVWVQVHQMPSPNAKQLPDKPVWQMNAANLKQIAFQSDSVLMIGNPAAKPLGTLSMVDFLKDQRVFEFPGQEAGIPFLLFSVSPDSTHAAVVYHQLDEATGRGPSQLCLFDLKKRKLLRSVACDSRVTSPSISDDNQVIYFLLARSDEGTDVGRWDVSQDNYQVWNHARVGDAGSRLGMRHVARVESLPNDKQHIQVTYYNRDVEYWDAQTGQSSIRLATSRPVVFADFLTGDQQVVTVHLDGLVRIWDATSGDLIKVFDVGYQAIQGVALHDDLLAVGGSSEEVAVIDLAKQEVLPAWKSREGVIDALAWVPDEGKLKLLVASSFMQKQDELGEQLLGSLRMYDPTSGEPLSEPFATHPGKFLSLAVSSDGTRMAATSTDKLIRLWVDARWEKIAMTAPRELAGHSADVSGAAFTGDGKRLVTGSADGALTVWFVEYMDVAADMDDQDTASSLVVQEFVPLKGHRKAISSIVFSPDDRMLLTSSLDRQAILWFSTQLPAEQKPEVENDVPTGSQ